MSDSNVIFELSRFEFGFMYSILEEWKFENPSRLDDRTVKTLSKQFDRHWESVYLKKKKPEKNERLYTIEVCADGRSHYRESIIWMPNTDLEDPIPFHNAIEVLTRLLNVATSSSPIIDQKIVIKLQKYE